jgi:hypothetical protein
MEAIMYVVMSFPLPENQMEKGQKPLVFNKLSPGDFCGDIRLY